MAELGYTKFEVYDLTLGEILALREGIMMKNSRNWEQFRFVSYIQASSNPYRKGNMPAIHNFLPLLSDKERYAQEIDQREYRHNLFKSLTEQHVSRWKN